MQVYLCNLEVPLVCAGGGEGHFGPGQRHRRRTRQRRNELNLNIPKINKKFRYQQRKKILLLSVQTVLPLVTYYIKKQ